MQRNGAMLTPALARQSRQSMPSDVDWWREFWRWADKKLEAKQMTQTQLEANEAIMEKEYAKPFNR